MSNPDAERLADSVALALIERGFRETVRSTAVRVLRHPDAPGLEVRLGTVYVVAERDDREIYRRPLSELSDLLRLTAMLEEIANLG